MQLKNELPGLFPGYWSLLWTELLKTGRIFFSYGRKNTLTTIVDYLGLWASVPGFQAHAHTHTLSHSHRNVLEVSYSSHTWNMDLPASDPGMS